MNSNFIIFKLINYSVRIKDKGKSHEHKYMFASCDFPKYGDDHAFEESNTYSRYRQALGLDFY